MFKILDRYIINECWLPFTTGCGVVTGVWLGADQVRDAFRILAHSDINPLISLWIILLNIPKILLVTLPVGVMLGTFLVYERLSNASELVAMRASGISLMRVALPGITFGIMFTCISLFVAEVLVPRTEPEARRLEFAAAYDVPLKPTMEDFTYFERSGGKHIGQGDLKRIFHVHEIDTDTKALDQVTILDFGDEQVEKVHVAESGRWNPDRGGWSLFEGVTYVFDRDNPASESHTLTFEEILVPTSKPLGDLAKNIKEAKSLSLIERWRSIQKEKRLGIETESLREREMEFHRNLAYPFSCLALALIGVPLGVSGRRARTNWGYIQAGLLVFSYFALQSALVSLGDTGKMNPFWAAWLPNFILGGVGMIMLYRKSETVGQ